MTICNPIIFSYGCFSFDEVFKEFLLARWAFVTSDAILPAFFDEERKLKITFSC